MRQYLLVFAGCEMDLLQPGLSVLRNHQGVNMRILTFAISTMLLLTACGGGGSSGNRVTTAPLETGGFTLLAGDMSLDGIDEVNIDIESVVLIGAGGQEEVAGSDIGVINLLDLRNVTQVLALGELPARQYSKIRLFINSLEIVESDGDREDAQLPANGKIDLNPQGPFEISADQHLILQIDFDLERSLHLVQTGNSRYRFRPVVFIDVLNELRLTRLVGTVEDDDPASEPSDIDLCNVDDAAVCYDLDLDADALILQADGTVDELDNLERGAVANAFGHFVIVQGGAQLFETTVIAMGDALSVAQINGDATSDQASGTFDLVEEEGGPTITVNLVDGAKVLDELGDPLVGGVTAGQEAEAWAQQTVLDLAGAGVFPAFLVQARDPRDEDAIEGDLLTVDGDVITVDTDEGEVCISTDNDTEIQLLSGFGSDAETMTITLAELADLVGDGVEIEAYGRQDGDCFAASFISAEVD